MARGRGHVRRPTSRPSLEADQEARAHRPRAQGRFFRPGSRVIWARDVPSPDRGAIRRRGRARESRTETRTDCRPAGSVTGCARSRTGVRPRRAAGGAARAGGAAAGHGARRDVSAATRSAAPTASSSAPATIATDAPIRRTESPRLTASPSRTEPHAAANTVADSRSGATPDNGATLRANRMQQVGPEGQPATDGRAPDLLAAPANRSPPADEPHPDDAGTTTVVSHRIAAYGIGSMMRASRPGRSRCTWRSSRPVARANAIDGIDRPRCPRSDLPRLLEQRGTRASSSDDPDRPGDPEPLPEDADADERPRGAAPSRARSGRRPRGRRVGTPRTAG